MTVAAITGGLFLLPLNTSSTGNHVWQTGAVAAATPPPCSRVCVEREKAREKKRIVYRRHLRKKATVAPYRLTFTRIAGCESGGNWHIETGNGFSGGLQFTLGSWYAVGGRGRPSQATTLEQMYRGVLLMRVQGWGAWPVCRRAAGV